MDNIFIELIKKGTINHLEDLQKAFRKIAKKTHPDVVGSDKFILKFIQFKEYYEEAKLFLRSKDFEQEERIEIVDENYRLLFFQEMQKLDSLELPHNKNNETDNQIKSAKELIQIYFKNWKKDYLELFLSANKEYEIIKNEKRKNNLSNLRKPSIYNNLSPVFFNICNYHITGLEFYQKQLKRNLNSVILRLEENNYLALKKYLLFLIDDMKNGPAVFG